MSAPKSENEWLRQKSQTFAELLRECEVEMRMTKPCGMADTIAFTLDRFGHGVPKMLSEQERLVLAGLEMLATQRALTWAERCAHAELARRVDAIR